VSNPALALQTAMREALLAHAPLATLLQGQHVYDELPRGAAASLVVFGDCETRDYSTKDHKAHEHFVTISVRTNSRGRKLAQDIAGEIETVLDNAALTLAGHSLVSLRLIFWTVAREKNGDNYGAVLRFRAATETN